MGTRMKTTSVQNSALSCIAAKIQPKMQAMVSTTATTRLMGSSSSMVWRCQITVISMPATTASHAMPITSRAVEDTPMIASRLSTPPPMANTATIAIIQRYQNTASLVESGRTRK